MKRIYTKIIQKVVSFTQKEKSLLNIFSYKFGDKQPVFKMGLKNVDVRTPGENGCHFLDTSDSQILLARGLERPSYVQDVRHKFSPFYIINFAKVAVEYTNCTSAEG